MRIENWSIVRKEGTIRFSGNIFGHTSYSNGSKFETTPLIEVSTLGETVRGEEGEEYEVGKPAAFYEAAYPNARERFFAMYQKRMVESFRR